MTWTRVHHRWPMIVYSVGPEDAREGTGDTGFPEESEKFFTIA
jgi:hypothetical protein